MKENPLALTLALCLLCATTWSAQVGTAFTYQGKLTDANEPATGQFDFTFSLFNAAVGGAKFGASQTNMLLSVSNGVFVTLLDFGSAPFTGTAYWLEIGVRTNGSPAFSQLAPRQQITPTPYAIAASNLLGTLPATKLTGTLPSSALSGTYSGTLSFNNPANTYSGNGSGLTGITPAGMPTNHYLFAYTTSTVNATANFVSMTLGNVPQASGWTTANGFEFSAPASGLYLVQLHATATTANGGSGGGTLSLRASLNGYSTEIPGSQTAATIPAASDKVSLSRSFLVALSAGNTISLQIACSSSGFYAIAPAGTGTTRPSASMTIIRVN